MVLISYRGDLNAAFWLDGFLPEQGRIERAFAARFPEQSIVIGKEPEKVYRRSSDEMASALLEDLYRGLEKKYRCEYSYLLLHHNHDVAPRVSALVRELERDSSDPRNDRYKQLITVCEIADEKSVRSATKEMARRVGLKMREDYDDLKDFNDSVESLLELVVEPFAYPRLAAARQLSQFGLRRL